jgi:hypothetical protein
MSEAAALLPDAAPAAPAPLARYAFRRSALEQERTFTLHPGELVITTPGEPMERLPLTAIREVHLHFHRTKYRDYYQCRLRLESGRKVFLHDQHWAGFAEFEARGATFTPFIHALHQALLPHRDRVRFRAGSLATLIATLIGTFLMAGVGLVALVAGAWLVLLVAAVSLFALLPILPRSRPRDYLPESPPTALLPALPR